MARNSDYIYDVAEGWQPITDKIDEILNVSSFEEDHLEAIKDAGYSEYNNEKIDVEGFTIKTYRRSYEYEYPYLLAVSDGFDVNIVLIANYISFQKCIAELVTTRKEFINATSS